MNNRIDYLLKVAVESFEQRNFNETKKILKNVLAIDSKNFHALHITGVVLGIEKQPKEALFFLQKAQKVNPQDSYVNFNLAKTLSDCDNDLRSVEYHEKAIKLNPLNPHAKLNYGISLHKLKRYADAIKLFDSALDIEPNYYEALIGKGLSLQALKLFEESQRYLERATNINPKIPETWCRRGDVFQELLKFENAIYCYEVAISLDQSYFEAYLCLISTYNRLSNHQAIIGTIKKCIQIWPNKAELWFILGTTHHNLKQFQEAIECFDTAIGFDASDAKAWSDKGLAYYSLGNSIEAINCYKESIKLNPRLHVTWSNKGIAHTDLHENFDAIQCFDMAISLKPNYAEAWSNKGNTFNQIKQFDMAIDCYNKAIALDSGFYQAWSNKGMTLYEIKNYQGSIEHLKQAIKLNPTYPEAWSNLGTVLQNIRQYDAAKKHYQEAIHLNPYSAEALANMGSLLQVTGQYTQALEYYEKAYLLKPNLTNLLGDLIHVKMRNCDWHHIDELISICIDDVNKSKSTVNPFQFLALTDDPELQKKCAIIYCQEKFTTNNSNKQNLEKNPMPSRKIKVGYFSSDFREHPISTLTAEIFELHDKSKFEISLFSYGKDDRSLIRSRIRNAASNFFDLEEKSDDEIVEMANRMRLDIAIDLGGHTANNRLSIFSHRVAPIQITYLGFIGTLGTNFMDYLIADEVAVPPVYEKCYSEKIIRLPNYQPNDRYRLTPDIEITKKSLGIPEDKFIFCCFNNNYKITPKIFKSWMNILKSVDNSILYIYVENDNAKKNLIREALQLGVDASQIHFANRVSQKEYMSRYKICDLFLDTTPYNGGTTVSDALWMNLPVVTCVGKSFASRMAASLLTSLGLEQLICNNTDEYERLAIDLANKPESLRLIKENLIKHKMGSRLFDSDTFIKKLEKAYTVIHENYVSGKYVDSVDIE